MSQGWLDPWPMLQSLATDGVVEGVGAVFIFLPQILILFLLYHSVGGYWIHGPSGLFDG